ncbi:MAG: class I SAM-dependent methyltransferase [Pseudomonadota bacterium]
MKRTLKNLVVGTPLAPAARAVMALAGRWRFESSDRYWEERYRKGGNSGAGSYGRLAAYKAEVLNDFVAEENIQTVIEFGSGDGNQVALAQYPAYVGVDISETVVAACRERFAADPDKTFLTVAAYDGRRAELALSLDVIYHLVEDETYHAYMAGLFDAAERFVIVYASNKDEQPPEKHVRHRRFTDWIAEHRPQFRLTAHMPNRFPYDPKDPENSSFADFFVFARAAETKIVSN